MFNSFLRILRIDQRYKHNVESNLIWLGLDRVVRLGLTFVTSILLARFLSLTDFGTLNYLMSFFVIFAAIGSLGTNGIAVKLMSRNTKYKDKIIISVFLLSLIGYSVSALVMFSTINLFGKTNQNIMVLSAILSSSLLLKSNDALRYWFEAKLKSKFIVLPETFAVGIIFIIKLILIYLNAPLIYFVVSFTIELFISALGMFLIFVKESSSKFNWKYSGNTTVLIFQRSWPIAISIFSIVAYMKIDQIMIGGMLGLEKAGIYSVAVIISESIYFLPVIINQTLRPIFFKDRLTSYSHFMSQLQLAYKFMVILALSYSIFVSFFANVIIRVSYGPDFMMASGVLVIHAWAAVFVFLNNTTWVWHISENKQKLASIKVIFGLILNIVLNYVLIPIYGITGAAIATLISRMFSAYLLNALFKDTRQIFLMMSYALIFRNKKWVF